MRITPKVISLVLLGVAGCSSTPAPGDAGTADASVATDTPVASDTPVAMDVPVASDVRPR
jgi:hypothetical protein